MNVQSKPHGARVCIVCGIKTRGNVTNPGWLLSLTVGAKVAGLTIARPDGAQVHDKCRDRLTYMIQKKGKGL